MRFLPTFSIICLFALGLTLQGCDAPRTTRTVSSKTPTYVSPSSFSGFKTGSTTSSESENSGSGSGTTTPPTGSGSGTTTTPQTVTVPSDAAHSGCSWSQDGMTGFQYSHNHLGVFSFCKSSTNETRVYIQVKVAITDSNVCFIPTTNVASNSTYIGGPRCQYLSDTKKIYAIDLFKNRNGYTTYSMTGNMIMKDKLFLYPPPFNQSMLSPDAYLYCSQWLALTGDASYCTSFTSVGAYVYHQF